MNTTGSVVFTSCSGTVAVGQRGAADAAGGPVEADVAVVAAEQGAEPAGAAGTVGAERAVNSAEAAVATVAVQDPAGPAGLPGPRRPVGAVADQRAPQQRHGRRVDRTQQLLLDVGGLGAGIRACRAREGLHDLLVKRRRLSAQRLIGLRVAAKQRRHGGGHLIGTGGQHTRRGGRGRSIGRADRRADACQIRRRRAQHFRLCKQKRHDRPPESCGYEQTCRDRAA